MKLQLWTHCIFPTVEQWGQAGQVNHFQNKKCTFTLPIAFTTICYSAFAADTGSSAVTYGVKITSQNVLTLYTSIEVSNYIWAYVLAIGK